ncbi:endolytic transglycosylase MltG [Halanaerobiaceae bacterium Z-7014]|uniref:Endolytic murein transglycosylase n=1 Tax=Halonatronomonas betaini TaxID=2778430 RepID=A0A931AVM2_9FIRM|nr:endolytic transglycosylase MltG [Halonatronomonas betaini]MBF8437595.1 endolytic transglycosylase MltG [Halonatronomonas betaini]
MKKAGILLLIAVLIAGAYFKFDYLAEPAYPEEPELFVIESGSSVRAIASQLEQEGWIRSARLFEIYVLINDYQGRLQAGTYQFETGDNIFQIANQIVSGRAANFRVTIPEGFTVNEIVSRLSDFDHLEEEDLLNALDDQVLIRDYFPDDSEVVWPQEGFLFPDTYNLSYEMEPVDIFNTMINRFESHWLEELENNKNSYTINEYVTMASLIEKEAQLNEEKPLIAGVIYNRLAQNMRLQLDATVQYALEERVSRVLYGHLEIESPYNTYLSSGLPPGPIASPGDNALAAVLEPEDSDYLFYFARPDGSHIFTKSYEEHLERLREFR